MSTSAPVPALPGDLRLLRLAGFLEGLSSLALFGIGMPLKYGYGYLTATRDIGLVHGLLWIVLVAIAGVVVMRYRWSWRRGLALFTASIIPLGPFFVDHRIPRWYRDDQRLKPAASAV